MIRQRELGSCYIYCKGDGACFALARSEYDAVLDAWKSGAPFFTGTDIYGKTATLRLLDVVGIVDASPESLTAHREDQRADESDDRADEMLTGVR